MLRRLLVPSALLALLACSSASEPTGSSSSSSAISTSDVIARAEEWVSAQVPYCQAANHQADGDPSCASVCDRPDNSSWDPYRSDCSGFVSWSWGLAAPGRTTSEFAPADTSVSFVIDGSDLQPGDALNIPGDHIVLFKEWITPNQRATFIEEPGCSVSTPYAHEFDSNVTINGSRVAIAYEGRTFTAIRFNSIASGGSGSGGSGGSGGSSASGGSGSLGSGRVCATGTETLQGVDVSKYEGAIDWSQVGGAIDFAFTRISDGVNVPDETFEDNWNGMLTAGVVRGAYQFFRASQDPTAQAQLVVTALEGAGGLTSNDLPVVMDIETSDGQSNDTVQANMQIWLDYVSSQTGRIPIIYTNYGTSEAVGTGFAAYPLWVANYTTACPLLPPGWSSWQFWQQTDSGNVPGIGGTVDIDTFNGSMADLQALVASGGQPPPGPSQGGGAGAGEACNVDADCQAGLSCQGGACADASGGDAGVPTPPPSGDAGVSGDAGISGDSGALGNVGDPCTSDLDCAGVLFCVDNACSDVIPGGEGDACQTDSDCGDGLGCVDGACSSQDDNGIPCACDGDCNPGADGSGQMCVAGMCVDGCDADWECPGLQTCQAGQCQ